MEKLGIGVMGYFKTPSNMNELLDLADIYNDKGFTKQITRDYSGRDAKECLRPA